VDLFGKVALVTGAARVGRAVVDALASRGCAIVLVYRRSRGAALETAAKARAFGADVLLVQADLRRARDLEKIAAAVERKWGRLDIFVHMASPYLSVPPARLESRRGGLLAVDAAWRESLEAEARAGFYLSLRLAALMRRGGGGRIVFFADWLPASGRPRYVQYPSYYVAKAAVKAQAEYLALALAPKILVNAIAPGPIEGPASMSAGERARVARGTPLGRWGGADELAKAVLFLIDTGFVTGETIRVDGGRHLK
jgi:NAD(P)-dependent dehydrogenase (short-subunit alcohol dehydrogenase family)